MKAMAQRTWNPDEPLELLELPTPEPRRGEVRVKVQAVGVNPVDWKMRSHGPLRLAARLVGPKPPVVVGVDFAGVVEVVGPGVTRAAPGDRVVGGTNFSCGQRGSYADTVLVREDQLCRVPDSVDIAVAAALPIGGVTAWKAVVDLGRIRHAPPGDRRVLVLGASGGVGQLAVRFAVHYDVHFETAATALTFIQRWVMPSKQGRSLSDHAGCVVGTSVSLY
jgi:NADPH:quinone reductase-like Zn-dependent oxidoreductase